METWQKAFAKNLRELRKQKGYTQSSFAKISGYSEKTIAKWENCVSVPSIESLIGIAKLLNTNIDRLFRTGDDRYYLGIDGGGTKTALVLADKDGKVINSLAVESCQPFVVGVERAKEVLDKAIYTITKGISLSNVVMFAGIAGCGTEVNKKIFHEFFAKFHFDAFDNDGDNHNVIALGLGDLDGITMISGTGFCIYQVHNGEKKRYAGWGNLFDDGGSGYHFGRDAISAYFKAFDGSGEKTLITDLINAEISLSPNEFLAKLYSEDKSYIASFSRVVFKAGEMGDKVANDIIKKNMNFVASVLMSASKIYKTAQIPVVLVGGVATHCDYEKYLVKALPSDHKFIFKTLKEEPVLGAVKLAMKLKSSN